MTKRRPLPTRAWKMVEMRKKTTPLEAEKAFKKLEGLGSSNGRFNGPTHAQVLIRKPLREVNSNTVKNDLGPGPASGHSEAHTLDVLDEHIKVHKLPLVKSLVTPSDGNCWYSAVCDQIRLTNIHGKPNTPDSLRKTICDVIPSFPQAQFWITKLFHGQSGFRKFLTHHKKNGEWTNDDGVMCQATALYLERNINIVGTANTGSGDGFTKLEGGGRADMFPPIYIGYYQVWGKFKVQ